LSDNDFLGSFFYNYKFIFTTINI